MFNELALNERLLKALDKLELTKPTPVQQKAIPVAMAGKDLLVSARTGSGKTAAFVLPILHRLLANEAPQSGARALILVPTRELARQVMKQCEQLGSFTFIKSGMIIGGEGFKEQRAMLRKNPEILIATPGRLVEHLDSESLDFNDLEVLVLDEADRMLEMGFSEDLLRICNACPGERQTMLFSATLKRRGLDDVIDQALEKPKSLILDTPRKQHTDIKQQIILADDTDHKIALLEYMLQNDEFDKALVFSNTRDMADRLCGIMRGKSLPVGVLHGEMDQRERNQMMQHYRDGHYKVLIATDLAARGLDIKGIDLVINFEMPRNGDDYIHRIGRTGRADAEGAAISMVCAYDWNLKAGIEKYTNTRFAKRQIEGLIANFKGPKKLKASGKAAGSKKKKVAGKNKTAGKKIFGKKSVGKKPAPKSKQHDPKSSGRRRDASLSSAEDSGFASPKRKKTT